MATTHDLEGRPHYVVPVVMLTVGSFSGSGGQVYYPADELLKSVPAWNFRPCVLFHPQLNGLGVSAADPQIINNSKLGIIFNTRFDGKRLLADAWIDQERVNRIDKRVAYAIQNNRPMEVSTGLFIDVDDSDQSKPIAMNHRPDHLALLPEGQGACSLSNGCGLLRNSRGSYTLELDPPDEPLYLPTDY